jgi:hypothetical protein
MNSVLLLSVLAQVASAPLTWSDGKRTYKLYESRVLVAEPRPTEAGRAALLELGAKLVIDRPTMRVWKVNDASSARSKIAVLRPVLHDSKALIGRYRVPLALVCDGSRVEKPWLEVLEGSNGACLPDFWYPPVLK